MRCAATLSLFISSAADEPALWRDLWSSPLFCNLYLKSVRSPESWEVHIWSLHVITTSLSFLLFKWLEWAWTLFYKVEQLCSGSDRSVFMWQQCLSKPYPCEFIDRGCWVFIANKRWLMILRWEVKFLISVKNLSGVGWRRDVGRVTSCVKVRKGLLIECAGESGGVGAVIKLRGQTLRPRCHLTPWLRNCRVAVSATAPSDVFVW